jgi:hypothetical protein
VRLKLEFFVIVGVPMKCGDAAAARIGAISNKAYTIVAEVMPIFLMLPGIVPRILVTNNVNTGCETNTGNKYLEFRAPIFLQLASTYS